MISFSPGCHNHFSVWSRPAVCCCYSEPRQLGLSRQRPVRKQTRGLDIVIIIIISLAPFNLTTSVLAAGVKIGLLLYIIFTTYLFFGANIFRVSGARCWASAGVIALRSRPRHSHRHRLCLAQNCERRPGRGWEQETGDFRSFRSWGAAITCGGKYSRGGKVVFLRWYELAVKCNVTLLGTQRNSRLFLQRLCFHPAPSWEVSKSEPVPSESDQRREWGKEIKSPGLISILNQRVCDPNWPRWGCCDWDQLGQEWVILQWSGHINTEREREGHHDQALHQWSHQQQWIQVRQCPHMISSLWWNPLIAKRYNLIAKYEP